MKASAKKTSALVSAIYRFTLARAGVASKRRSYGHHNQPNKKAPDEAVLQLRREHQAASTWGDKDKLCREFASLWRMKIESVRRIAGYYTRSNPDRPLDPSLGR